MFINAKVLHALQNALKIGMVAESPEAIPLIESVQPVVLVNDRALTGVLARATINCNLDVAGEILVAAYTCPAGKRSYISSVFHESGTGATQIAVGTAGSSTLLEKLTALSVGDKFIVPYGQIWLDAGESLGGISNDNGADGAIPVSFGVVEVPWGN